MSNKQCSIIAGLTILHKYAVFGVYKVKAENGKIFARPVFDYITNEDQEELERLGWFYDEDLDYWCHFV